MNNNQFHSCPICGYRWQHGKNGHHNCASLLKEKNQKMTTALKRVKKWIGEFPPIECFLDDEKTEHMSYEKQTIADVIESARTVQEFLWHDMNSECGLEEFKRMLFKRMAKIDEISMKNPHYKIELKKRLLQLAAISINLITKIDNNELTHSGIHPILKSNLPNYAQRKY